MPKFWNGKYEFVEGDKCITCIYPGTCAVIEMIRQHSLVTIEWSYKQIKVIIYECPCRDLIKENRGRD